MKYGPKQNQLKSGLGVAWAEQKAVLEKMRNLMERLEFGNYGSPYIIILH